MYVLKCSHLIEFYRKNRKCYEYGFPLYFVIAGRSVPATGSEDEIGLS